MSRGDAERLRKATGTGAEANSGAAARDHLLDPVFGGQGPDQHCALTDRYDVEAPVQAVGAIDIGMPGRAEHRSVGSGRTAKAMRCWIVARIGLGLDDRSADTIDEQGRADEPGGHGDGVEFHQRLDLRAYRGVGARLGINAIQHHFGSMAPVPDSKRGDAPGSAPEGQESRPLPPASQDRCKCRLGRVTREAPNCWEGVVVAPMYASARNAFQWVRLRTLGSVAQPSWIVERWPAGAPSGA